MGKGDRRKRNRGNIKDEFALGKVRPANYRGAANRKQNVSRSPSGRVSRSKQNLEAMTRAEESAIMAPNLQARCRQMGIEVSEENMISMKSPITSCEGGQIIWLSTIGRGEDLKSANRLWQALKHASQVCLSYDKASGAPHRHPKIAKILTLPEAFETGEDDIHLKDERTDEQIQAAADKGWNELKQCWHFVDPRAAKTFQAVAFDDAPCRDFVGFLNALNLVADMLDGERLIPRVRKVNGLRMVSHTVKIPIDKNHSLRIDKDNWKLPRLFR